MSEAVPKRAGESIMKLDGKSRSDSGKRVSIRKVVNAVVVLSVAVGVGIVVREFYFLSSMEKASRTNILPRALLACPPLGWLVFAC